MTELVVLSGLPGSGKTTLSREYEEKGYLRINWDDRRRDGKWTRDDEEEMQSAGRREALDALKRGQSVIADNTHLTPRSREKWFEVARLAKVPTRHEQINTSLDLCIERDRNRSGKARVGRAVIEKMAFKNGLAYIHPSKRIVLVDMDGTLADCEHRRHHLKGETVHKLDCTDPSARIGVKSPPGFKCPQCGARGSEKSDWPAFFSDCDKDPPIEWVRDWVEAIGEDPDYEVIIVSGRPTDFCGIKTEEWLDKWRVPYDHLLMRDRGDMRPDTIVKKEILDLLPKEQIQFVIDDRKSVCEMWRENGLYVIQVAEGNF